ncbi:MAG: hypothetical protein ACPF9U_04445 [Flavobacteriaceae bacterium]
MNNYKLNIVFALLFVLLIASCESPNQIDVEPIGDESRKPIGTVVSSESGEAITIMEGSEVLYTINLDRAIPLETISYELKAKDDTAKSSDYELSTDELELPPYTKTNSATLTITNDGLPEPDETFVLTVRPKHYPRNLYNLHTASESITQTITVKSFVDPDNALCAFEWDNTSDLDVYIIAEGDPLSDANAVNGYNMATGSNPEKGSLLATTAPDGNYHVVANVWTGVGTSAAFTLDITDAAGTYLTKSGNISWSADGDFVVAATINKTGNVITFVD